MGRQFDDSRLVLFDPDLPAGVLNLDRVLFLDFDGVLHPEGCGASMEFMYSENFCEVMAQVDPAGEVPIVISSMWRFDEDLKRLRSHLEPRLGRQVVGVTPDRCPKEDGQSGGWGTHAVSGVTHGIRQDEIETWMQLHAPGAQWLAIDDRADAFAVRCPHLFLVPGIYEDDGGGIDAVQALRLKARLREFLGLNEAVPAVGVKKPGSGPA